MCREVGCNEVFWRVYGKLHYKKRHPGVEVPKMCRLLDDEIAHLKNNSKYAKDPPYMKGKGGKRRARSKKTRKAKYVNTNAVREEE